MYKLAVENGDKELAYRLLDNAYKNSGVPKNNITFTENEDPNIWFHGAPHGNHIIFDSSKFNATVGGETANGIKGNFLTTDLPTATRYAGSTEYSSIPELTALENINEKKTISCRDI